MNEEQQKNLEVVERWLKKKTIEASARAWKTTSGRKEKEKKRFWKSFKNSDCKKTSKKRL